MRPATLLFYGAVLGLLWTIARELAIVQPLPGWVDLLGLGGSALFIFLAVIDTAEGVVKRSK
jgi:hypothetical protein